jgi:hypothetical protein
MKKTLVTIAIAAVTLGSFAQGYFSFTGNPRTAWDGFTTSGSSKPAATLNVGFLFGTGSAMISGLASSVPTNSFSANFSVSTAWTDILNDPNFAVAATGGSTVVQATASNGSWSYNGGNTFAVTGSAVQTYNIIEFAWSSAYATPQAAAAAGSPVGWGSAFSYTSVSSIGTPLTFPASGATPFGVVATPVVTPEPTTLALAGLGGASLLLFRRRK